MSRGSEFRVRPGLLGFGVVSFDCGFMNVILLAHGFLLSSFNIEALTFTIETC